MAQSKVRTLILDGREYVLVPVEHWQRARSSRPARAREADSRAAAQATRALARLAAGKSRAVPLDVVKHELGL